MPLALSQILDRATCGDPRRLGLYDSLAPLGSLDFYVRRSDLASTRAALDTSALAGDLSPLAALAGRLSSVRVFLPPYGPRRVDWEYPEEAFREVDAVLAVAERLRDVTRAQRAGMSFHHVTEWPVGLDAEAADRLRARLEADRERAREFVRKVTERCVSRDVIPELENVAPVRNDHPFPGARYVPRLETGFCGPNELAGICRSTPGLRCVLDVCHLALGCEAKRAGTLPRLNRVELDGDPVLGEAAPYRFTGAIRRLAPVLEGAHVAGCAGPDKRRHEGGVPGDPDDRIDLEGLLAALARAAGDRTLAVTLEIAEGHTEAGLPQVERGLRRVAAAMESLGA